ncbi:MAG TPA: HAMP domain-containing sensor histidine kinase [Dongiaceae bacterium]|nr:HAMP domain-containing sensor histidine kinase [Dongiaceae bacterium]
MTPPKGPAGLSRLFRLGDALGPRAMAALVLVLALSILGGAVLAGYQQLHRVVRDQLVNQEGEILDAVAQFQEFNGPTTNLAERLKSPIEELALALQISQLPTNVLGVRLFDPGGRFVTAFPETVTRATLDAGAFARLRELRPVSRYYSQADLADFFLMLPPEAGARSHALPLLEVNIPIHARDHAQLLACAQLLVDGRELAAKAAALDFQLRLEGWAVFVCGGALLGAVLIWGYRRLERTNRLLHERTEGLLRANHELTLAAKTTALGAVSAHLIHGLSNPLACLQIFMSMHEEDHPGDLEWKGAVAATRRMQDLVQDVVRVLAEEDARESYEITLGELAQVLESKVRPLAQDLGVHWEVELPVHRRLSNHRANVILLILENLVSNALQVTPRGKRVRTSFFDDGPSLVCEVADQGPGFPETALKNLFVPCRSTKGGAGLGLAISKQLAGHLEAALELRRNGPDGCAMALTLPSAVFSSPSPERATVTAAPGGQ